MEPTDPSALRPPDGKRYMEILDIFNRRISPSLPVCTNDLADVVNGRDDIPLPSWSNNVEFERELEYLIDEYSTIMVCFDCDQVIGFLKYSREESPYSIEEMMYVAHQESLGCHCFPSHTWGLADSLHLRSGEKISIPPSVSEEIEQFAFPQEVPGLPLLPLDNNERLVDAKLRELYPPLRSKQRTDYIPISRETIEKAAETIATFSPSLSEHAQHLRPLLYLRPVFDEDYQNVLGCTWHTVKGLLGPENANLKAVGIGILPHHVLTAWAFHENGAMAIIIGFAFFQELYFLNQLTCQAIGMVKQPAEKSLLIRELRRTLFRDISNSPSMECKWRQFIETHNDEQGPVRRMDPRNYMYEDEMWVAHHMATMQQAFVLLHELDHLHRLQAHATDGSPQRNELLADEFALNTILRCGAHFFPLEQWFRSIFWLFEFWHALEQAAFGPDLGMATRDLLRKRWGAIADAANAVGVYLCDKEISDVQTLIEDVIALKE